jgi:hypothetical protein
MWLSPNDQGDEVVDGIVGRTYLPRQEGLRAISIKLGEFRQGRHLAWFGSSPI